VSGTGRMSEWAPHCPRGGLASSRLQRILSNANDGLPGSPWSVHIAFERFTPTWTVNGLPEGYHGTGKCRSGIDPFTLPFRASILLPALDRETNEASKGHGDDHSAAVTEH